MRKRPAPFTTTYADVFHGAFTARLTGQARHFLSHQLHPSVPISELSRRLRHVQTYLVTQRVGAMHLRDLMPLLEWTTRYIRLSERSAIRTIQRAVARWLYRPMPIECHPFYMRQAQSALRGLLV